FGDNVAIEFAAERGVWAEAAANENVIPLDRIVVFVRLDLAGEQSDLRHKMLRAGMVAASQMNIDRRVERNARLAPGSDVVGMTFGVRGREFAARVSGARDEAGTDRIRLEGKPQRFDPLLRLSNLFGRTAGDEKILPDRQPQIAVAEVARDCGEPMHLRNRHAPDRQHDADPVQPFLLLPMDADMRGAIEGGAWRDRARHRAIEFAAELLLEQSDE